jgi:hypothetical protein
MSGLSFEVALVLPTHVPWVLPELDGQPATIA